MRSVALLTILFPFMIGITAANGQRFGTSTMAPRGPGVAVQAGPTVVHSGSRFGPSAVTSSVTSSVPGAVFIPTPHLHNQIPIPVFVPHVAPQPFFRAPIFQHHPGTVIIDVPYFSDGTVITQVAPGVVREERRQEESPWSEPRTRASGQLAPFDPTPQDVVNRMLELAAVKPGDVLYDLGAGDGRVVITAAKKYRIKAVGYEIDPGLVKLARENVRKQGVGHLVEIRQQDFLSVNLSPASVVTMYLSYDGNLAVRPQLMRQLRAGARVISYTFDIGEWQPKIAESYRDAGGDTHMIYLWQIGEPLAFR